MAGVVASLACGGGVVQAQVNVEPMRARLAAQGHTLNARFALTGRAGNSQGFEIGGSLLGGLSEGPHLIYLTLSGDYSRQEGTLDVANTFAHSRYNYRFTQGVWGELFAQVETDRFRSLKSRELLGSGPRFRILSSRLTDAYYGTSAMLEVTRRGDEVPGRRQVNALRWNNYLRLEFHQEENVSVSETLYVQPRFDDFSDYWLLSVLGVKLSVNKTLASRFDLEVRREAVVPPGVDPLDVEIEELARARFLRRLTRAEAGTPVSCKSRPRRTSCRRRRLAHAPGSRPERDRSPAPAQARSLVPRARPAGAILQRRQSGSTLAPTRS